MNWNSSQQSLVQRTLNFINEHMLSAAIGLVFWAMLIALISCPVWLPALVDQVTHSGG